MTGSGARTPLVQAYAVLHDGGVSLIDTTTTGQAEATMDRLGSTLVTAAGCLTLGGSAHPASVSSAGTG